MKRWAMAGGVAVLAVARAAAAGDGPITEEDVTEANEKQAENRADPFQEEHGAYPMASYEFELITDRGWHGGDQQARIGGGFMASYGFGCVENLRLLTGYVGLLVGQAGDARHQWIHLQGGWRPNYEIPVGGVLRPFVGARVIFEGSTWDLPDAPYDDDWDAGLVLGGAFGARFFGGILTGELTGDAAYSLDRGYVVGDTESRWVGRLGFNIRTDVCAFVGGPSCEHSPLRPKSVDLDATMSRTLWFLAQGLGEHRCPAADAGVSLREHPTCPTSDDDGFFCRMDAYYAARNDARAQRLVGLAKDVHDKLDQCLDDNRSDELAAGKMDGVGVRRKLRYGPYPSELRRRLKCDAHANQASSTQRPSETEIVSLLENIEEGREACPLAALALDRLEEAVAPHD